jgi:hypothetical protein
MPTQIVDIAPRLAELGLGEGWKWDKGSWWLDAGDDFDVRASATRLLALNARFIAITAMEREDKQIRLDYQWDLDGALLSFTTATRDGKIASIVDLSPAADWVERETFEYFSVTFTGRESLLPLMTRNGDASGINLRKEPTPEVAQ